MSKIIRGAEDALAYAKGDKLRGQEVDPAVLAKAIEADKRLRDAAPDLLAALEAWASEYEGWSHAELVKRADPATIKRLEQTRAAIAKARP